MTAYLNTHIQVATMEDGYELPLEYWPSSSPKPEAVVLAVHGLNDYGSFFATAADYLHTHNITSYGYDQRGFGRSANVGSWAGTQTYVDDLRTVVSLIKDKHPGVPLIVFGESMGGGVVLSSFAPTLGGSGLTVNGIILSVPAVWGREVMPAYQSAVLWVAAHTVPSLTMTGRGLNIQASDNIEMLRAWSRDPLVIKETRVDVIWGVVDLMDHALEGARSFDVRSLVLYGDHDEVIRPDAVAEMIKRMPTSTEIDRRIAVYEDGWHMLTRDLSAKVVLEDMAHWILKDGGELPSGADKRSLP